MACIFRLKRFERGFVLDGVPLGKLANDETQRTQPSLNFGIPFYSPLEDKSCSAYYQSKSLPKGVRCNFQKKEKESETENNHVRKSSSDRFILGSSAVQYLDDRKKIGAGMFN